ncbi:DUF2079 domain-containing protein [candidate division FCPU426 bacterium]|nr:DUF2079 domain-containing protein [candidate division FCPU426 bacterium]
MVFPPRLFLVYCIQLVLAWLLTMLGWRLLKLRELPRTWAGVLLWTLVVLQAVFFWATYMADHYNFLNGAVDMATISQSLWNIMRGNTPFETILGTHALRVHFSLLWYAVAQIFRLWPSIAWLVLMSTLSVALTAVVLQALAREILHSEWLALAIGISYLLNPYLQLAQMAAGHADSFDTVFMALSLWALWKRRMGWFWISMLIALTGKEDVGLYYLALGIAMVCKPGCCFQPLAPEEHEVRRDTGRPGVIQGLAVALAGGTWSLLAYTVLMPAFGPDTQNLISRFGGLGDGGSAGLAKNILMHPWLLLTTVCQGEKVFSIFYLLSQSAFSIFASGWALLPLGFSIWLKSITNYVGMYNFWDHYSLHIMPFLYFCTLVGLKKWMEKPIFASWRQRLAGQEKAFPLWLAFFLIVLTLLINLERGQTPFSRKFSWSRYALTDHARIGHRMLQQIPPGVSVAAQEHLAPHLSFRREIYAITSQQYWRPGEKPWYLPEYAVFDLKGARRLPFADKILGTADYFYATPAYIVAAEEDGWVIFKKTGLASPAGVQTGEGRP